MRSARCTSELRLIDVTIGVLANDGPSAIIDLISQSCHVLEWWGDLAIEPKSNERATRCVLNIGSVSAEVR
jgi:hypothetical protein